MLPVLLMLARYNAREEVLIDPMCGSGTIPIEAALMATAEPRCVGTRKTTYLVSPDVPTGALFADTRPLVIATEREAATFAKAVGNVRAAKVSQHIQLRQGHYRTVTRKMVAEEAASLGMHTRTGLILANPPYGRRLSGPNVSDIYRDLHAWCQQFSGWRAAFLMANAEFEKVFGRPESKNHSKMGHSRRFLPV